MPGINKKPLCLIAILLIIWSAPLFAADQDIPFSMEWDHQVKTSWKGETTDSVARIVDVALQVVASYPPHGDHLFSWKGDNTTLRDKKVVLYLSSSQGSFIREIFASQGKNVGNFDGDALTAVVGTHDFKIIIATVLLLDRLLFAPTAQSFGNALIVGPLRERPDALARTIIALSHEIYGNVQADLELSIKGGQPEKPIDVNAREVKAFQAGVDFIDRLTGSPTFRQLPVKIQNDLKEARMREAQLLIHWKAKCAGALSDLDGK